MDKMTTKQPTLRFPEFEGAWEEKKFKDLYSFKTTNSLSRDKLNYDDGKIKNIHYGDIHTKFGIHLDLNKDELPFINHDVDVSKYSEETFCKIGDLVIADASEDYEDIGKTIEIVNINNEIVVAGLHTFLARKTSNDIAVGFVSFMLRNEKVRIDIKKIAQGIKVLSLSTKRLGEIFIHFTSLPEQQKIASFLTAVDKRIQLLEQKKTALEQYKKGVMQKIFSQKISFKDDQGNDFPDWEEKKLGEVSIINPDNDATIPEKFIYIDLESVEKGKLIKKEWVFRKSAPSRAQRVIQKDDILFQLVRPYQQNNFYFTFSDDFVASTGYAILRGSFCQNYLYYVIHTLTFFKIVIQRCTGTSFPAISPIDLGDIFVPYPSLPEQQKIASFLSALDEKIAKVAGQLEKMQQWKKGLLRRMFV